jgi:antitoxin MazE
MLAQIQKWGNSLGIRIPSAISKELGINAGSCVDIIIEDHQIIIKPQEYSLDVMLAQITQENLHDDFFPDDSPLGSEVW